MTTYDAPADAVRAFVTDTPVSDLPEVTTVVPVYDDPDGIDRTVRSLADCDYPAHSIHVVYTPSTGETEAALSDLETDVDELAVHRERDHETPGAARNVAIDRTDADGYLFVDADMAVEDGLVAAVGYLLATTDADYVSFPVEMEPETPSSLAGRYDRRMRFPVATFLEDSRFAPTCSLAVRASVFETGLRFNPSLYTGEDVVFGHEVHALGFEAGHCPDVGTRHPVRKSVRDILSKGVKTGWGWREIDAQYGNGHVYDRPYHTTLAAWLPTHPAFVAHLCREWESLSAGEKATTYLFKTLEDTGRTWGYLRALAGDASEEPPPVIREWYEAAGTVKE